MKIKQIASILALLFILLLAACGDENASGLSNAKGNGDSEQEVKTIRAGTSLNKSHPGYAGLTKFKEIIEEKTQGGIIIETFHSGQIGDDRAMVESAQLGTLEVALSGAPITNFVPELAVFDLPFLFPNEEVADAVLDGEVGQKLLNLMPEQNLIGLGFWELGFRDITNGLRPIATADDLNGLKIRTTENEVHLDAFKALGANPTPMSFNELFTGLQQGVVDGQENPYAITYLESFYEVQKYISNTHHIYSPFALVMGKNFFDSLTEEEQKIVKEAAVEAGLLQRKLNREANDQHLASLIEEGMIYTEITAEAREEMIELVSPAIEKHSDKVGKDLVNEVFEAIEAAK